MKTPKHTPLLCLIVLSLLAGSLTTGCAVIREGEVGVKSRFGKFVTARTTPGLMGVNPFTTTVYRDPIRTVNRLVRVDLPSSEGLTIATEISILYHVSPDMAVDVLRNIGPNFEETVIMPTFRSAAADVTSRFVAKDMHSKSRDAIEEAIEERMMSYLQPRGIVIESVLMKSVTLPANLSRAIEEKMEAEQQSQRMQYVLDRERKEAERRKIEAEGIRDANQIVNQGLTDQMLQYKAIEAYRELSKSPNSKVIITDGKGLPLVNPVD